MSFWSVLGSLLDWDFKDKQDVHNLAVDINYANINYNACFCNQWYLYKKEVVYEPKKESNRKLGWPNMKIKVLI